MSDRFQDIFNRSKLALELISYIASAMGLITFGWKYVEFIVFDVTQGSITGTKLTVLLLHTVIIIILIVCLPGLPEFQAEAKTKYKDAILSSHQFLFCWYVLWVGWLATYALRSWMQFSGAQNSGWIHLSLHAIAFIPTAALLLCYLVMVVPSVPAIQFFRIALWVLVSFAIYIAAEAAATRLDPDFREVFDGTEGLVVGVVIALFVGRLESTLIDSPRWVVACLYGYAVLQFGYPIFEGEGTELAQLFVLSLALALKVLLFWHVQRLILSGRLTYYMIGYRQAYARGPVEWNEVSKELFGATGEAAPKSIPDKSTNA
jgi:hypothetical protein